MVNTDQLTPLPFIDPQSATTTYTLTQFQYEPAPTAYDDIEQARKARKEEQERLRRKNERELWKLSRKEAGRWKII